MKKHTFGKSITSILLILSLIFTICGQTGSAAEDTAAEEPLLSVDPTAPDGFFSAVLYDNTNGLPTAEANTIAETADGFIWIGSYGGLIRYDGNTFERMDSTNGISSVVSLYADSKDRLWIGTNDSGAAVMENNDVRKYDKTDGLASLSVRSVTEDEDGNIYIATTQGIAVVDGNMDLHKVDDPRINEEYIRMLKRGSDNTFCGVTMSGCIFTMRDGKITDFCTPAETGISDALSVFPDNKAPGYLYIGTKHSLVYYGRPDSGPSGFKAINTAPLEYINSLNEIDGSIWVCSDNGLGVIKQDGFKVVENIPVTSSFEYITTDYQGNLWAASSKQGVMKIVPDRFQNLFEKSHLPSEVVNATCLYNGMLFIGTKSNGLIVLKDKTPVTEIPLEKSVSASGEVYGDTDLIKMLEGCRIRSMIRDSADNIWISTFGENGLVRFDGKTVTKFTPKDGMPSDRARTVTECSDGRILAACTGGLAIIDGDKVTKVYDETSGISNTEILTVAEAQNGDILLGTDGGGIYIIHDEQITNLTVDSGLSSDVVMRIKRDDVHNVLWLVTSNSIAYMTDDYTANTIHMFPYSNNFDLYENKTGDIWVLSSNGIYVANVDELLENGDINTEFYGRDSGLPCIATANSYSELSDDGYLYIAASTGVVRVNIDEPFTAGGRIKIAVPCIEADDTTVYPDRSGAFLISPNTQKITIYSYVYNYSLINPQVTYYLDGFEDNSTTVKRSDLVPISYTNLRGGKYNFIVRLDDPNGGISNAVSIPIVKEKAFYEHLWFYLACAVLVFTLLSAAVAAYIHYRNRQFIEKDKAQKQFIHEIVEAFAKVVDMKDKYTNGHSSRVAEYTAMLAKELGYDDDTVSNFYHIALLHDIGKIGVPEDILNKPGKLTDEEYTRIKSHSTLGYEALINISIMPEFAIAAWSHHERPDGKGYPRGLKGDEIPRVAQIIAVADTFDAMYSNRPYRKRMNFEKAVSIVKEVSGTQLTSDVVDAFLRLVERGKFRAPDDDGGGTTENIDNIHAKFNQTDSSAKEKSE